MRGVLDVLPTLRTNSEGEYPVFAAREVSFVSSYADNPFEVQTLKELMLHHSINVNYFTSETPTAAIALTTLASYYRLMLGIDPLVQCRIHQTTFALCDDIDLRLDCPFSALPHSRSLQFLSFWRGSLTRAQIPNEQWAWIGYAIFHPESPRSSWSGLKLDRTPVTRENIKILEAMAQGNNLRAIQLGLPPQNTAYHGAELRVGAFVHTEPKLDSEIYLVACKQITVDVCLLSEDELMTLPEWVGVIVPSYGIGWTLAANLQHFESRKASESCLKSLVCESRQPLIEDLERLLSVIGSRLRFLDICDNRMVDAVTLASYLHHCPVLESLRVCHDGSLWKHPTNNCPRLKKLALKLQPGVTYAAPSVDAAKTSFQNVQELRIETLALSEFEFNRDPLRAAFEVLDRLEYLHFACKESGAWLGNAPLTYEEARAESWECMGLQADNEKTDVQVNGCIAFLSVLRKQRDSAMHHVDRDILDKIFEFAIARPRKIWIDSNGRPLVRRQSTAMF
ncbi:hypothetical protein Poli38472_001293 [Pythium oligandrum]|uniref:Uncharacterized protein n=1 Tax=Pythium oligandrum TaxID=41045 RepID=A0A8K1FRM0_PYTOL|nr:hypothetical protein Poli38472_001293 [Pythium oligandrum]|eukprot:TMW69137.1 hypothetical protein Poli38472_001293 [Pythium oligandrum]